MLRLCSSLVLGLALAAPVHAEAGDLRGPAQVIDGDTIRVATPGGPAVVRLHGIDAPERDQTCADAEGAARDCGASATAALDQLIGARPVTCQAVDIDRYDRVVARCRVGGTDLGGALVAEEQAWAYAAYSIEHVAAENAARAAGRGVWAGQAQAPWDWRAARRTAAAERATERCDIKGNISARGHIYHLPGSRSYDRTGIDADKGERWFCSEEQALAAGWRAPQG
ncbi:MAG TPA: thermonuclease family protein [Paracoccus sp. (in: a-proteobacteria)]|nr:thermonuclease family protein [Paracoccus sp. (in: a-proteobacteria)]